MRTRQLLVAVAATVLAGVSLSAGVAQASTATHAPAVKLAVSPTRVEIPSTRHHELIRVYSGSAGTVHISTVVDALGQTGKGGFVLQKAPAQYGAAWLTITPSSFALHPGQVRDVRVAINVPPHQVGQRYLAIVFRAAAPKAKGQLGAVVSAGVASSLIIDVPGKIRHNTTLGLHAPSFSTGGSIPITMTIANRGNFYALLNGLKVTDPPTPAVQFPGLLVLAGTHTTATATWTKPPMFGFPAHLTLMSNGKAVATASVWIVPVSPIAGAVGLLVLAFMIFFILRKRREMRIEREVTRRTTPASE